MRESNFAFPAQNRAAVCISSQLYDRRGAPFPDLFAYIGQITQTWWGGQCSARHQFPTPAIQLPYPPHLPHLNLTSNTRDHGHGRRPRAPSTHAARLLHLPSASREPGPALRPPTAQLPPTKAGADADPKAVRQARRLPLLARVPVHRQHRRPRQRAHS